MKNIAKEEFLIISQFYDPLTHFNCIGSHIFGEYGVPWGPTLISQKWLCLMKCNF